MIEAYNKIEFMRRKWQKYKDNIEKYKEFDKYVIEKSIELINKNNKYFNADRLICIEEMGGNIIEYSIKET